MHHLTFLQAVVIGVLQGVTELFPISSLGHSVLVPALVGGSWQQLVTQQSQAESPYLAFIVGLHVATATALLVFFWREWVRIIAGFFRSLRRRRVETVDERLAWLLVIATIPAGITGLAFEHLLRTVFAKPVAAGAFLMVNAVILFAGEQLRRRATEAVLEQPPAALVQPASAGGAATVAADVPGRSVSTAAPPALTTAAAAPIDVAIVRRIRTWDAVVIGAFQVLALFAGISRSGITMVAGLLRGLSHEQAVRFAFLLATPIIMAAGVYKVPDLMGHLGNGIRGQVLAGAGAAFLAALLATGFLVRYFRTRTLRPFAVYSALFGAACVAYFR